MFEDQPDDESVVMSRHEWLERCQPKQLKDPSDYTDSELHALWVVLDTEIQRRKQIRREFKNAFKDFLKKAAKGGTE